MFQEVRLQGIGVLPTSLLHEFKLIPPLNVFR